jgi:hypothetical protein
MKRHKVKLKNRATKRQRQKDLLLNIIKFCLDNGEH